MLVYMLIVLVRVTTTAMKNVDQKQVGEEMIYMAYTPISLFVLISVSFAVTKHHDQRANWAGWGLLGLYFNSTVHCRWDFSLSSPVPHDWFLSTLWIPTVTYEITTQRLIY